MKILGRGPFMKSDLAFMIFFGSDINFPKDVPLSQGI